MADTGMLVTSGLRRAGRGLHPERGSVGVAWKTAAQVITVIRQCMHGHLRRLRTVLATQAVTPRAPAPAYQKHRRQA